MLLQCIKSQVSSTCVRLFASKDKPSGKWGAAWYAPKFQREAFDLIVETKHHWYASRQFSEQAGTCLKFNGNWKK